MSSANSFSLGKPKMCHYRKGHIFFRYKKKSETRINSIPYDSISDISKLKTLAAKKLKKTQELKTCVNNYIDLLPGKEI